jgi:hypothetical protein
MENFNIEIILYKILLTRKNQRCFFLIKIFSENFNYLVNMELINDYINDTTLILSNGRDVKYVKYELFKENILSIIKNYLDNNNELIYLELIENKRENLTNLYFKIYDNKIDIIINDKHLQFNKNEHNIKQLYKIINFIDDPMTYVNYNVKNI